MMHSSGSTSSFRRLLLGTCCAVGLAAGLQAHAQAPAQQTASPPVAPAAPAPASATSKAAAPPAAGAVASPVRITVLADLDDDIYNARSGAGGVDATRMAVADFGGSVLGRPIVVDTKNDHNKPADAPGLADDAYNAGTDLIMDVQNSPIAVAVSKIAAKHHRLSITTESATPSTTRADCSKYSYNYSFDLVAVANAAARNITALPDGKRWVAIVADTGFGHASEAAFAAPVTAHGGKMLETFVVRPGADLTAVLQQAAALHPDVIGVFSAGADEDEDVASVTKAGLKAHVTIPLLHISDVDREKDGYAGVRTVVPWYWDMDKAARAWSDRFAKAHNGVRPTESQAADYSATTQWLQAVKAVRTTDADAVVKYLDGRKINDMFARHGEWRAADHAMVHDLYVVEVQPLSGVKTPHAWYRVVQVIPAAQAFPPETAKACKM